MVQVLWKVDFFFLVSSSELKIQLLYDPAIPILDVYPKELKAESWTNVSTSMFIAVLFKIVKT